MLDCFKSVLFALDEESWHFAGGGGALLRFFPYILSSAQANPSLALMQFFLYRSTPKCLIALGVNSTEKVKNVN